jgi:hypothetical protein
VQVWEEWCLRKTLDAVVKTQELRKKVDSLRDKMHDPQRARPEEQCLLARLQTEVG